MDDRLNTTAGWVLFAGIIALGLSAVGARLYHADRAEAPEEGGYFIQGAAEEGGEEAGPSLATLLAAGDAAAGAKVFAKCTACHTVEQGGAAGIGPNLYGVVGTPIGQHAPGFAYSDALKSHGGNWDYAALDAWLKSPRGFAEGTKMSFAGLSSPEDRANVILYMRENGGGPELPTPEAPAAEAAAEDAPLDGAVPATEPLGAEEAGAVAAPVPVT
ncbi:cytochrome c family protein [Allopontixanthobacter sp.]|uniref:c-type cytochrome n=1 Tax=Allopontixanthobacter sp. TaxID=2906452 RepID=UPI002ABCBB90|nr:cytochrome c family protein [Allopontixanthobacter sp.]MDZ4307662.1 cytochrome c family protein [Allopontixanthobacter sp.]